MVVITESGKIYAKGESLCERIKSSDLQEAAIAEKAFEIKLPEGFLAEKVFTICKGLAIWVTAFD